MRQPPVEVLIVEDNDADVSLTLAALQDPTIANEIHTVGDGDQAIAFLKREGNYANAPHPDLVLLDLNLPNKNGFQVLAEMKADPRLKTIPVIVFSGSDEESDIAQAYDLQISAYLVKPTSVDGYFSAIRAVKELWFHMVAHPPKKKRMTGHLSAKSSA